MSKFKKKKVEVKERSKKDRLPEETIDYYKRVSETFNEGFSDEDEKDIFLKNVLSQLEKDGVRLCYLASTSRILQTLIQNCSSSHVALLFRIFKDDWESLITNIYASHVMQDLIRKVPHWIAKKHTSSKENASIKKDSEDSDTEDESNEEENVENLFCELCVFIADNLDDFICNTHASHIIRTCFEVLGGHEVQNQLIRDGRHKQGKAQKGTGETDVFPTFTLPDKFRKYLKKFSKFIFKMQNIKELLCDRTATLGIQTLLLVLHHVDDKLCQKYVNKILELTGLLQESEDLLVMVKDETASYIVEQLITIATPETLDLIYKSVFKGKLLISALHPIANFLLQKLITHVQDKEMFEEIFEKLSENLEDILAFNHMGLVVRIAETCLRLRCKQEKLVRCLMKAFHCEKPEERQAMLVPLVASLTTYEVFYDTETKENEPEETEKDIKPGILSSINYHGSVLLQKLFCFGNPRHVMTSMIRLKPVELKTMSCDPCGSHMIDAFFQSSSIGEKGREQLIHRLQGVYKELACSQHGSRSLEAMWKVATVKQKTFIAGELVKQEHKLRSDRYGFYIHRNFALMQFSNRRSEWTDVQTNNFKRRKLFTDLIGDTDSKKMKLDDSATTTDQVSTISKRPKSQGDSFIKQKKHKDRKKKKAHAS